MVREVLATSQHDNRSWSCCHKTQALRPLLSAASILREGQTHYREGEREREREMRGVSRPVAEGLILNVLQRQCLLSSLASPLTAAASKQDLSPLPPPDRKRGRKKERLWLLKLTVFLPGKFCAA